MPRNRNKIQEALRQRKQNESAVILEQAQTEDAAYQCFFKRDAVPSPIESGVTCILKLAKLNVFPNHEEHFPLYTGERLADMVESIRRYGVQTPILVWKTAQGKYIIISGHNRVNASIIAGLDTIPSVVRTDLTKETAEDLFFEMNFRQRSLADMIFSQRVLCVAAHYNLIKKQGRRTDLQNSESTSPDTQEKSAAGLKTTSPDTQEMSHADAQIAQEYELTRDKVSKYCRYSTMYRPLLLLMDHKKLGQLAAYEVSFVTDHTLQKLICQIITEDRVNLSVAKAKKLRRAFEAGKLGPTEAMAILSKPPKETSVQNGRRVSITISPDFAAYFPKKTSKKQIEETIQKALRLYFKTEAGVS